VVALFLLLALGLVYGLGSLCFIWWDSSLPRRILMLLCAAATLYATINFIKHNPLPDSVTHQRATT
jgi:hypothetical protein